MGAQLGDPRCSVGYLAAADTDPLSRPSYQDMSMGDYGGVTYGKTATMLFTLEPSSASRHSECDAHVLHELSVQTSHQEDFVRRSTKSPDKT